ncbi:CLUMA_CG011160, isoform A [Clunio marinus]|uniref:Ubiquitin thioesterase OTU n=1 Tax=Clunio marinus TaxID=568069 RepID=A0A1J1IBX7_9DIPT|nr:CLUMA_CG011160, isoform A [Clunio marinus]
MGFALKIKTKNGDQHIISDLNEQTKIEYLKNKIQMLTQIPPPIEIRSGFPPKLLSAEDDATLKSSGISSGETLIVDTKPLSKEEKEAIERAKRLAEDEILARQFADPDGSSVPNGILLKQVVDADNSCLFTSIGFILSGKVDTTCGNYMRQIIAQNVHNDKETYNSGILGRDNAEYCAWIMQESNWGGAIEVSILSQHYGIEFDVVDITNAMINRFGEDKQYPMRGFLLYDGIHYDPLYLESLNGDSQKTLFSVEDEHFVFEMAQSLANEAKSSRQYTDVDKFTLKCLQCDTQLKGQNQATVHAKETGHTQFGEV